MEKIVKHVCFVLGDYPIIKINKNIKEIACGGIAILTRDLSRELVKKI